MYRAHVVDQMFMKQIAIYLAEENKDSNKIKIVKEIITEEIDINMIAISNQPPLSFSREEASILMDGLWNVGIRPTDLRDVKDLINAKDKHIADLQKILSAYVSLTSKGE